MLRLNTVFTCISDPLGTKTTQSNGVAATDDDDRKEVEEVNIVGQEKDGSILIARKTKDRYSYIELWDPRSRKTTILYKHPGAIKVVAATLNEEKTLIVFTVKRLNSNYTEIYESYVAELSPTKGDVVSLLGSKNYDDYHRVQFLYADPENAANVKKSSYCLLITRDTTSMYQIPFKTKDGVTKLNGSAVQKGVVIRGYVWCEWDPRRCVLYTLTPKNVKGSGGIDPIFRCFGFPDKKYNLFDKDEKDTVSLFDIPISLRLPTTGIAPHNYIYPYSAEGPAGREHMHIVNMRGNSLCLCQQHEVTSEHSTTIEVSIFLLHYRAKIDFSIPIREVDPAEIKKITVFFDTIADMLLVYIPGHHFQLVDCSEDHGPASSITLSGEEYAPIVGNGPVEGFPVAPIVPFEISAKIEAVTPDLRGHCLLDCKRGVIYEYTIDRESVWKLFDLKNNFEIQLQALHLAIIHMQDTELVAKIMMHTFAHSPHNVTASLLNEFLIGTSYLEVVPKIRTFTESPLERLLPISYMDLSLDSILALSKRIFSNIKVFLMSGYTAIPGTKVTFKEREEEKRFVLTQTPPTKRTPAPFSPVGGKTRNVSMFFRDLLGLDDEYGKILKQETDRHPEENAEEAIMRRLFLEALAQHLSYYFQKDKPHVHAIVNAYSKIQGSQVTQLYAYILKSNVGSVGVQFQILEHFYCSLEELAFPFPKNFNSEFSKLGYECLPRNVFIQYIDRGVIVLDEEFIREICKSLENSTDPADYHFKLQLVSKLEKHQCFDMMKELPETHNFLIQHLISTISSKSVNHILNGSSASGGFMDMEIADSSPFIPLSVFLHTFLRNDELLPHIDTPFVDRSSKKMIGETFQISFADETPKSTDDI